MRTLFFVLSVCTATLFTACDEIDKMLTFSIGHETTFQVESTSPLNLPFEIGTPDVTTNSNQSFENNNTNAALVKDIRLEELKMTVTNPNGKTFAFLKSVAIYISTDSNNEILLASLNDIPTTATTITLTPTDEKLDAYVKASSYQLRTSVVTRETLTQDVDVKANLKFKVTAKGLN